MIRYQGFMLPLPEWLMRCFICERGVLLWDGRNAWRCTGKRCREGRSLAAFFDIEDIELRLQCGYRLDSFPLTDHALDMLRLGVVTFDWLSAEQAQWMFERFDTVTCRSDGHQDLAGLAHQPREIPARREVTR